MDTRQLSLFLDLFLYDKEKNNIICSLKCYINYHINLYTNYLSIVYDNLLYFIIQDEGEWWV